MPEKEKELETVEPLEIGAGDPSEKAAPAASPEAVEIAAGEAPAAAAEPVSREEFERLRAERDQLVDRLARAQAEFDNARKRSEREKLEFREIVSGSIVEKFLPVLDNLQLALKSSGTAEQVRSGVDLIVKQMQEVLRQMQVVPISAEGEADTARGTAAGTPAPPCRPRSSPTTACSGASGRGERTTDPAARGPWPRVRCRARAPPARRAPWPDRPRRRAPDPDRG